MTPNKHQQRTEATQKKLIAAALRIFARDGFEASRIEDIATEAGHTRGAFYANFESKEDLFFALLEQQAVKRIKRLRTLLESVATGAEQLTALRKFYLERLTDRQWVMLALEFRLFALRHGRPRAKLAAAHERVRASLKLELVDKLLGGRPCSPIEGDNKVLLEVTLNGLVLEHAYDPKRLSKENATALLGRVFDLVVE
jgi:AcrR family transcriptional regulator